jgi:hypothetical protein
MKVRSFGMIVLGLFSIVGLAVGSRPGSAAGQKIVTRTEDGVPVVYNPKKPAPPAGVPSSLVLKHDFTIGRESGDENYMFSELRSVQVDDQDRGRRPGCL